MKKFIIGKTYKSCLNGLVVRCLKNSPNNQFTGVVISKYGSGHVSSEWNKEWFEECDDKIDTTAGNNGWTKIESEKDLPTEFGFYTVGNFDLRGKFLEFETKLDRDSVHYNYRNSKITHYRKLNLPPNF